MPDHPPDSPPTDDQPRGPAGTQFGLMGMLLTVSLCGVLAGAGYYLVRGIRGPDFKVEDVLIGLFIAFAGPTLTVVLVSLGRAVYVWILRLRR